MGIYRTTGKTITDTVARNIARRMHDLGVTWDDLHETAKLAHSTIARLANGRGDDISHASAARLCDILQTTWPTLDSDTYTNPLPLDAEMPCFTAAGFNSCATIAFENPQHPQIVMIPRFTPTKPIHTPFHLGISSASRVPTIYRLLYGLKTYPWRACIQHIITLICAAFRPHIPNPTQLQLALDYTNIFHDGESDPEAPHA